jgi:murein L,D-transpeptidase YcbB/YkuD
MCIRVSKKDKLYNMLWKKGTIEVISVSNRVTNSRTIQIKSVEAIGFVLCCLTPHSNNISVILWRSVLLVEETGENHRPVAIH